VKKLPIGGGAAAVAAGAAGADVVGDAVRAVAAEAAAGPGAVAVGASSERFLGQGAKDGRVVRPRGNSGRSESCRPIGRVGRVSFKSCGLTRCSLRARYRRMCESACCGYALRICFIYLDTVTGAPHILTFLTNIIGCPP
jgi:hypothetical protein